MTYDIGFLIILRELNFHCAHALPEFSIVTNLQLCAPSSYPLFRVFAQLLRVVASRMHCRAFWSLLLLHLLLIFIISTEFFRDSIRTFHLHIQTSAYIDLCFCHRFFSSPPQIIILPLTPLLCNEIILLLLLYNYKTLFSAAAAIVRQITNLQLSYYYVGVWLLKNLSFFSSIYKTVSKFSSGLLVLFQNSFIFYYTDN